MIRARASKQTNPRGDVLLQAVADGTTDGIFVKDLQGRILMVNRAGARFVRKPVEDLLGKDVTQILAPVPARQIAEDDNRVIHSGKAQSFERTISVGSRTRTFFSTKAPYRDPDGRVIGIIGISRDITDRKRAEKELSRLRARLELRVFQGTNKLEAALKKVRREITERRTAAARLTAFAQLGRRLNSARSRREAAQIILNVADQLIGWDSGSFQMYSSDQGRVFPILNFDIVRGRRAIVSSASDDGRLSPMDRRVLRNGGQLVLGTWRTNSRVNLLRFGDVSRPSASRLFVPIRHRKRSIGILSIQSYSPNAYDKDDLRTLQALADQCGGALERIDTEDALRESEARKSAILQSALDAIITIDHEGKIVEFNPAAERIFGHRRDQAVGRLMAELIIPPHLRKRHHHGFAHHLATGKTKMLGRRIEMTALRQDGTEFPVELGITRISRTGPPLFTGFVRDITEHKRAGGELRKKEKQLLEAQQLAQLGSWEWEISANKVTWSDELYRIYDLRPRDFGASYEAFLDRVHPNDRETSRHAVERCLADGKPYSHNFRIVRPDGSERVIHSRGELVRDADGKPFRMFGTAQDITERQRSEEALRQFHQQVVEVQEAERRRVARDLHDAVGQLLASIRFRVRSMVEEMGDGPTSLKGDAVKVQRLLDRSLQEVRRISRNLRPSELDDLGLVPALRSMLGEFQQRTGLKVAVSLSNLPRRIPPDIELTLYRIIQEALSNVEKHSGATRVSMQLARVGSFLHLKVKDNGRGFTQQSHHARVKKSVPSGLGLVSIRERTAFVGGASEVKSRPRDGTEVVLRIPLKTARKA
jgi:two-component system sensor histidine kinase UhpB